MTLIKLLQRNVGYSLAAAGFQLLSTLTAVWLAGPAVFADLTVDIFKLAVLAIFLEIVPSPYATIRWQRDPEFAPHMATFAIFSAIFCLAGWMAIAGAGLFSHLSWWMAPYAFFLGIQRYLDVKLQAENRVNEYFQILFAAGVLRLVFTAAGLLLIHGHDNDVLWAALSLSLLLSSLVWFIRKPGEIQPFVRSGHGVSIACLYAARVHYYAYYLNTALKRLRDSFLPVAASFVVGDKVELARYLLAMRAVEFVVGQLRVVEALLANLDNRAAVHRNRTRQLLMLAALAQLATFAAAVGLAGQAGFGLNTLLLAGIASLFVYPYVFEIGYRSDAYAVDAPLRVTISFAAYALTLAIVLAALAHLQLLTAPALVTAPVMAQLVASLTYLVSRRTIRGRHTSWPAS